VIAKAPALLGVLQADQLEPLLDVRVSTVTLVPVGTLPFQIS
jgi:hypothetical protein